MAFALDAIVNDVTYSLSDGDPFRLESAQGLAMPSVRRLTERGPRQDGDTDLGYRLEPRTITLALNFYADTYAALDGHRDTLATIFKPARGYDIKLRVTRDDGAVRQIDCHTVGPVDVRLVREERPGKLHRAVVQLRAADPTWYDPTQTEETLIVGPYWAQGDTETFIPMSNILDYDVDPEIGQVISGSVAIGNPWSFFFETTLPDDWTTDITSSKYLIYYPSVSVRYSNNRIAISVMSGTGVPYLEGTTYIIAGNHQYALFSNGGTAYFYRDNVPRGTINVEGAPTGGTEGYWRDLWWAGPTEWDWEVGKVAFYDVALTADMRDALFNPANANTIVYEGDWPVYPTILLNGPITTPTIAVAETDMTLTFGTRNLAENETWTIAWTNSTATVYSSMDGDITDEMTGYADWKLQPDPVIPGGTHTITITSGTSDGTLAITPALISYTPRFLSY